MSHPRLRLAALALALSTALPAASAGADEIDDYIAAEMAARRIPGLALAVARGGTIVRTGYYGQANVELAVPVSERSFFPIASLDKELTAAGVMRLVESGRVSLDEPVAEYVGGPWRGITLRHLLSHTSGLPDRVAPDVRGRLLSEYDTDELLDAIRDLEPVAPPGARYLYSDANFFLAQLVIERASRQPWRRFMEKEVFAPAGMQEPAYFDPHVLLPGRVAPYRLDADSQLRRDPYRDIDFGPLYNDVALTVIDFARWLLALDAERVLSKEGREAMWTPTRLNDGTEVREVGQWRGYGLGFGLDEVFGHRVVTHSGYTGVGFVKLPDVGLSVVVFTNLRHSAGSDPVGLAYGVAGHFLPDLSFLARPPASDPDPARTSTLRAEYERLLAGAPALERWAPPIRASAWAEAAALPGRSRSLGPLESFEYLGREGPEGALVLRARHERGRMFLRISLDHEGRIAGLQWHHV